MGRYISKGGWALAHEMASPSTKVGGVAGTISPGELIDRIAAQGDQADVDAYNAYIMAMHGMHAVSYSRGFAARYGLEESPADEDLAEPVTGDPLEVRITRQGYTDILRRDLEWPVLEAFMDSPEACVAFLDSHGIEHLGIHSVPDMGRQKAAGSPIPEAVERVGIGVRPSRTTHLHSETLSPTTHLVISGRMGIVRLP